MIAAATRQDIQIALDRTKNTILGSMFSRNDAQSTISQLRNGILQDLRELHAENQMNIRQSQTQHDQINQRINSLQHDVGKVLEQQSQILLVLQQLLQPNGVSRRY